MAKNTPPYILRNPGQLDRRFYDGFDHKFLFRKAQTLMYLFDQKEQFKELVTKGDEQSENTGSEYLTSQDIDDKYFEGLKAEVYFTEMHQFEGFFALLLALFQELPHWLYLTTYKTGEIKTAVQNFLDGHIKAITNNKVDNKKDFIIHAIYAGFPLSDENREVTLENIGWFLERLGERYLEAVEYNAYKHGLRVLTGPSQFSLRLNDANGVAHGPSYVLRASWTVSEIHPDYGEDLFVRIFNKGVSRPLYFFVQSKGCENITDYLIQGGMVVSYPVSTDHIEDWKHFLEPVILTVWDSKTKIAYWQIVQDALEGYDQLKKQGEFHIHVPVENRLNEEGIRHIAVKTLQRFGRYNHEEEIANVTMNYLEKRFNIKIDYNADGGVITVEDDKEIVILFCGETLDMIDRGARIDGLSEEILSDPIRMGSYALKALEESMELHAKIYEEDKVKGCFYFRDLEGNILGTFKTFAELWKARCKALELSEYSSKF